MPTTSRPLPSLGEHRQFVVHKFPYIVLLQHSVDNGRYISKCSFQCSIELNSNTLCQSRFESTQKYVVKEKNLKMAYQLKVNAHNRVNIKEYW